MKKCLYSKCGKEFEPLKPKAKFCSAKCRVYFNREIKPKFIAETVNDEKANYKKLWKPAKSKKEKQQPYDGIGMKTFTELAYDAGLPVEIEGMVIQKDKPKQPYWVKDNFPRLKDESYIDYMVRMDEQSKAEKTK